MARHMTLDTRKGIAHGPECRLTFAQLATMHGRAVSTIANEVKNRMRWSNRNYGCSNAACGKSFVYSFLVSFTLANGLEGLQRY